MKNLLIIFVLLPLSACGLIAKPDINITAAELNPVSNTMKVLKEKTPPKYPIPVAVYSFRDQTGQYKPQQNVNSFSTAVTQGATSRYIPPLLVLMPKKVPA